MLKPAELMRRLIAALPWYDEREIEARHARTTEVAEHSIIAREEASKIPAVRAHAELRRLETAARGKR